MIRRFILPTAVIAATFVAFSGGIAHAQTTGASAGNGMRVSPVRNDLTIKPGSSQSVDIYVENITGANAKLKGVSNDFVASDDESGNPRILLDANSQAPVHGLKEYIGKIDNFELKAGERKIIKVKITIPTNAAGGGYYGAVRFLPQEVDSTGNLSLSASVGSLILVTVPGDVKEQADISSLNVASGDNGKASNFFTNGNGVKATVRFRNTGNVQVSPFGKLQLKKGGKVLATYEINNTEPAGSVLPDSIRRFNVDFTDKAKTLGKYSVEGNFGYGSTGQLITAQTSFIVVPLPILITLVICILLIIAAIFIAPRFMKSHDRKIMRKLRRGKR